eukprot:scaffold2045_cov404-Prasinococcus_capsulatus_cf.AAC.22
MMMVYGREDRERRLGARERDTPPSSGWGGGGGGGGGAQEGARLRASGGAGHPPASRGLWETVCVFAARGPSQRRTGGWSRRGSSAATAPPAPAYPFTFKIYRVRLVVRPRPIANRCGARSEPSLARGFARSLAAAAAGSPGARVQRNVRPARAPRRGAQEALPPTCCSPWEGPGEALARMARPHEEHLRS